MKFLFLFCSVFFLSVNSIYAQSENEYDWHVHIADSLYQQKEYAKSAEHYYLAFESIERKAYPNDRYNAACSYALAGEKDSSFFHLYRLAESSVKYSNLEHITTDVDLTILHSDKRWKKLIKIVTANKEEAEKDFDKPLVAILDSIYTEDQSYRRAIQEIEEKYGRTSDEMKNHWKLIQEKDSLNLIKVQKILDSRGWLGPEVVGQKGNTTLFLVIQHSDLSVQEKYLPMMRQAVANGKANGRSLALLEDRVALGKGELQIYGSQIGRDPETGEHYVLPLIDPDNVDVRRTEVGLGPLKEYTVLFSFEWDLEAYKKDLPGLIEKSKE